MVWPKKEDFPDSTEACAESDREIPPYRHYAGIVPKSSLTMIAEYYSDESRERYAADAVKMCGFLHMK